MRRSEKKRTVVLHVVETLDEIHYRRLSGLLSLSRGGGLFRFVVCVLQPAEGLKKFARSSGAEVIGLDRPRSGAIGWTYIPGCIRDIARICRTRRVDVVHDHCPGGYALGVAGGLAAKTSRIVASASSPVVPARGLGRFFLGGIRGVSKGRLLKRAHAVVVPSEEDALGVRKAYGLSETTVCVIPNGVDIGHYTPRSPENAGRAEALKAALGIDESSRIILAVDDFLEREGWDDIVEAMLGAVARIDAVKLLAVGDGPELRAIRQRARNLGLWDHVLFLGSRKDRADVLAAADLFVAPSRRGRSIQAIREAMSSGKPIVATDIEKHAGLLTHDENAVLVSPGDPAALGRVVADMLQSPEKRAVLGANARRCAERSFDARAVARGHEALWLGRETPPPSGGQSRRSEAGMGGMAPACEQT